jgi:hypothetical protein
MSGIVLKPANRAAQLYVGGSGVQSAIRQQHQFIMVFNLYPGVVDDFLVERVSYLKEFKDRLHFLCNNVDGMKFSVQQDVMNQYNRKRVINRKIDYDPLTVRMYDTVDGLGLKFARTLYEFEFSNARLFKKKAGAEDESVIENSNYVQTIFNSSDQFRETHHFGMRPQSVGSHRILKSIDLYQIAGGTVSKARAIHPRLARMDMDTFDYSSSQPVNISLAFQYENLTFEELNVSLKGGDFEYSIESMLSDTANFEDISAGNSDGENGPDITKEAEGKSKGGDTSGKPYVEGMSEGAVSTPREKAIQTKSDTNNLKPFKGKLKTGEKIRNIDGKSYVVPAGGGKDAGKSSISGKSIA